MSTKQTNDIANQKYEFQWLFREFQQVLTVSYLILVIIGMISDLIYYSVFGINIFEYSQIFDFLIAPFKRLSSIILLLLVFLSSMVSFYLDKFLEKRYSRAHFFLSFGLAGKSWYARYRIYNTLLVFVILMLTFILVDSKKRKEALFNSSSFNTTIIFDSSQNHEIKGHQVGANSNYIFLMDEQSRIQIIPIHTEVERIIKQ